MNTVAYYQHTKYRNCLLCSDATDQPSEHANKYPVNLHHLKTKFIFEEPILRGFLAEANSIFQEVQALSKLNSSKIDYLKKSHAYRSILRGCLEKLQKDVDTIPAYKDYMTIFYSIECIWHLCEIFLIDPQPSSHPVPHLIEWIRFHFPDAEQRATALLFASHGDETYPATITVSHFDYILHCHSFTIEKRQYSVVYLCKRVVLV